MSQPTHKLQQIHGWLYIISRIVLGVCVYGKIENMHFAKYTQNNSATMLPPEAIPYSKQMGPYSDN